MVGWGTSFLRRRTRLRLPPPDWLQQLSVSQSWTIRGLENPESPSVIKSTSCFISWELSNYSSEDIFIANNTSELCPWLDFRLWLGLADQVLYVCVFLFLQHYQKHTGLWAIRYLEVPQTQDAPRKAKGISKAFCPGHELHLLKLCVLCPCNPFYTKIPGNT